MYVYDSDAKPASYFGLTNGCDSGGALVSDPGSRLLGPCTTLPELESQCFDKGDSGMVSPATRGMTAVKGMQPPWMRLNPRRFSQCRGYSPRKGVRWHAPLVRPVHHLIPTILSIPSHPMYTASRPCCSHLASRAAANHLRVRLRSALERGRGGRRAIFFPPLFFFEIFRRCAD